MSWTPGVQNHIHLSPSLGTAPENAPDMRWIVRHPDRLPIPTVIATQRRSIKGKLQVHRLMDGGGVVRLMDFRFVVKIAEYDGMTIQQRWDAMLAMHGERVKFVDSIHPANGVDHTPYVRDMYMSILADAQAINQVLEVMYVSIELIDDSL